MASERPRVLILGGTADARALASALTERGIPVLSTMAGRVSKPAIPAGEVRIGGFGGAAGLTEFLREHRFACVVDATHPFAAQMSANAAAGCHAAGAPLLRLARPGWSEHPAAGTWTWVRSNAEAVAAICPDDRVLLTIGRQGLADFLPLSDHRVIARVVEDPEIDVPAGWEVIRSRGPYSVDGEVELMRSREVTAVVTKDSGGDYTSAKLDAAATVGARLIVVARPPGVAGVPSVGSVTETASWAIEHTRTPD